MRGAICKKSRVVEKAPTIMSNGVGPASTRGRSDASHGTPPGEGGGDAAK